MLAPKSLEKKSLSEFIWSHHDRVLNNHLDKRNLGNWSWEIFHGSKEPLLCIKVSVIVEFFFLFWDPREGLGVVLFSSIESIKYVIQQRYFIVKEMAMLKWSKYIEFNEFQMPWLCKYLSVKVLNFKFEDTDSRLFLLKYSHNMMWSQISNVTLILTAYIFC